MQPIRFEIEQLRGVPGEIEGIGARLPQEVRAEILAQLLEALTDINANWLAANPQAPAVYKSGVRYKMEPGTEAWMDAPTSMKYGEADCEDLAAWRAAELRVAGIDASAEVKWQLRPNGSTLYHIVVGRNDISSDLPPDPRNARHLRKNDGEIDGKWRYIEDPSAVLGM